MKRSCVIAPPPWGRRAEFRASHPRTSPSSQSMQRGHDAQKPPPLPRDLAQDFERFRRTLLERDGVFPIPPSALESAIDRFREYGRLLYERAASLALFKKAAPPQIYTRHVLDSLNPIATFP